MKQKMAWILIILFVLSALVPIITQTIG